MGVVHGLGISVLTSGTKNRIRFEVLHQPIYARKLMSKNEKRINFKSQRSSVNNFLQ